MSADLETTLRQRASARGAELAVWELSDGRVEAGFVIPPGRMTRLSVAAGDRQAALEGLLMADSDTPPTETGA
jgi:hypothetical protein